MSTQPEQRGFPGFRREYKKDFFTYPLILEEYFPELSGTEQKVLTYILRRTLGFQKVSDNISLSQFEKGAGRKNRGAGVSRSQAKRCLDSLERKGFIRLEKHGYATTTVHLALEDETTKMPTTEVTASDEVTRLIRLFAPVAMHKTEEYLRSKKQISAMEKLVNLYGVEHIERMIKAACEIYGKEYMPVITSPIELETKLSKLLAALKRREAGRIIHSL